MILLVKVPQTNILKKCTFGRISNEKHAKLKETNSDTSSTFVTGEDKGLSRALSPFILAMHQQGMWPPGFASF